MIKLKEVENKQLKDELNLPKESKVTFKVSGLNEDRIIAPMLFIPIVENTFKHGFQSGEKNPYARFTLSAQGDELFFEAENSKVKDVPTGKNPGGTGLENLRKRLSILYPEKHILEIVETENSYRITLNISISH